MYCCSCQSSFDPVEECDCECHGVAALVASSEYQRMLSVHCPPAHEADPQHTDWAGAGDLPATLRLSVVTGLKPMVLPAPQLPAALDRRSNGSKIEGA